MDLKATDDLPALAFMLTWPDGLPVDLTGATAAIKIVRVVDGVVAVAAGAMVVAAPATLGKIGYSWPIGGLPVPGEHEGEITVTFAGGRQATFPGKGTISITINAKL